MHPLVIFVAKYFIVLPCIAALIVFIQLKKKDVRIRFTVELVVAGILALILARISSMLWFDPRPFVVGHFTPWIAHAADNGFPSDHTLLSSLVAWVIFAYSRKYGIVALIIAFLIGTSRVIAGVHHPLDILGSFVISGLAAFIVFRVAAAVLDKKSETRDKKASV